MRAIRNLANTIAGWFRPVPSLVLPPNTSLVRMDDFVAKGFEYGVQILNDNQTPMDFVISTLQDHLGMDWSTAEQTMREISARGGILLKVPGESEAKRIANAICADARRNQHPLHCSAVSAQQGAAADVRNARV